MSRPKNEGVLQSEGGAWGHAKESGKAPAFVKPGAKNAFDQAKGAAPDSGQTKGGSRQGGRKGSNSPTE